MWPDPKIRLGTIVLLVLLYFSTTNGFLDRSTSTRSKQSTDFNRRGLKDITYSIRSRIGRISNGERQIPSREAGEFLRKSDDRTMSDRNYNDIHRQRISQNRFTNSIDENISSRNIDFSGTNSIRRRSVDQRSHRLVSPASNCLQPSTINTNSGRKTLNEQRCENLDSRKRAESAHERITSSLISDHRSSENLNRNAYNSNRRYENGSIRKTSELRISSKRYAAMESKTNSAIFVQRRLPLKLDRRQSIEINIGNPETIRRGRRISKPEINFERSVERNMEFNAKERRQSSQRFAETDIRNIKPVSSHQKVLKRKVYSERSILNDQIPVEYRVNFEISAETTVRNNDVISTRRSSESQVSDERYIGQNTKRTNTIRIHTQVLESIRNRERSAGVRNFDAMTIQRRTSESRLNFERSTDRAVRNIDTIFAHWRLPESRRNYERSGERDIRSINNIFNHNRMTQIRIKPEKITKTVENSDGTSTQTESKVNNGRSAGGAITDTNLIQTNSESRINRKRTNGENIRNRENIYDRRRSESRVNPDNSLENTDLVSINRRVFNARTNRARSIDRNIRNINAIFIQRRTSESVKRSVKEDITKTTTIYVERRAVEMRVDNKRSIELPIRSVAYNSILQRTSRPTLNREISSNRYVRNSASMSMQRSTRSSIHPERYTQRDINIDFNSIQERRSETNQIRERSVSTASRNLQYSLSAHRYGSNRVNSRDKQNTQEYLTNYVRTSRKQSRRLAERDAIVNDRIYFERRIEISEKRNYEAKTNFETPVLIKNVQSRRKLKILSTDRTLFKYQTGYMHDSGSDFKYRSPLDRRLNENLPTDTRIALMRNIGQEMKEKRNKAFPKNLLNKDVFKRNSLLERKEFETERSRDIFDNNHETFYGYYSGVSWSSVVKALLISISIGQMLSASSPKMFRYVFYFKIC